MTKETLRKIWSAVKRIVEIIIAIICGSEITSFLS